ncbi:MAG: HD-GYP domain-containing protein, partial [Candidatus Krumholzibacteria bacterium]|nr:HD-GYP domain-containing protein [Candidatus Krumholzibacteria bacterium]
MQNNDLKSSIHKKLIWRLGLVGLVLSVLLAVGVNIRERNRVSDAVIERARQDVKRINMQILPILDTPGTPDPKALERELVLYGEGAVPLHAGEFVIAAMYDPAGRELNRDTDPNFKSLDAVDKYMDGFDHRHGNNRDWWHKIIRIDGTPCIHIVAPLENSSGEIAAHIEGVFVVSDEEIAAVRRRMMRTSFAGIGLVLLTTMLVYPIISSLIGRLSGLTIKLLDANLETLQVLGSAIAKRDSDTDAHNFRVTIYSVRLAEAVGLGTSDIRTLIKGAFLHDVGKIGVRDNVLLKPGPLSDDEYEVMKRHVDHGLDIVERSDWLNDARSVVGGHHEKFDGSGYHRGLRGEEIPVGARIFALADVFDALTSRRPYKEAFTYDDSMHVLETGRGTHFDP